MLKYMLGMAAIAALCLTGCPDDGANGEIPEAVSELIPQEYIDRMNDAGFPVYGGTKPPSIAGSYEMDSLMITYDEATGMEGSRIARYVFTYYEQEGDEITLDFESVADDAGEGLGSYISGAEGCFTVYSSTVGRQDSIDCEYRAMTLYSGCLKKDGIYDYRQAFVMIEQTPGCEGNIIPIGNIRIVDESDGLAKRLNLDKAGL